MTRLKSSFPMSAIALAAAVLLPFAALAAEKAPADKMEVRTQLTVQYIAEDTDLVNNDDDHSLSEQAQVSVRATPAEHLTAFFNGRALNIDGSVGFDDDTGETITRSDAFLELRELWIRQGNLGGILPLSLQAGRQRLREPRSLWWNDDFDLVRLNYDSTLFSGFAGIGENLASYRTGDNEDFQEEDEERLRLLGEASWQYRYNHFLEGRLLFENDHSGLEPAGSLVLINDRDDEDMEALWFGLRSSGIMPLAEKTPQALKYRADIIGLVGESDEITTDLVCVPPAGQQCVTGADNFDLSAWAFDGTATFVTDLAWRPVFTAGYAYGSGDDNAADGTDHAFRQSGLHGTSSRFGLERQQQRNYGEVLRPELSNLHILTAGAGVPVNDMVDLSLTYFHYRLAEDAVALRNSGVATALTGTNKDVGDAADLAVNMDVDDQFNIQHGFIQDIDFRFVFGTFFPGSAYAPAADQTAYRAFTEVKFRF